MRELLRVYRREWLGLVALLAVFTLSFYLVMRAYSHYRKDLHLIRQTRSSLAQTRDLLTRLETYGRYPFWRRLTPPQEIQILEKVGLRPLEEAILKLSELYTERGFFFLEEFRLNTCVETGGRRRGCVPHLLVRGKKAVF